VSVRAFALPDLGEGLTEGEILQWLVAAGEDIALNQPIVEVETAKAAVEVPSPFAGRVTELCHPAGATVDVGSVIIRVDTGGPDVPGDAPAAEAPAVALQADLVPQVPAAEPRREAVLVGYGVRQGTAQRRPRVQPSAQPAPAGPAPATAPAPGAMPQRGADRAVVLAKPPVRKLAKDLGVEITALTGTGAGGVVTREDVTAAAQPSASAATVARASRAERRIPVKGVRKVTAQAMVASATTAPHATLLVTVDVTETMALVRRLRGLPELADVKISPLAVVAKALLDACRRHPEINARWDDAAQEIVVHGGVHLGIAAATPRGLLVPNIKDADLLPLADLARALQGLTETARAGRTAPADLTGGTITITNVGVFGVDTGIPILNPGEAAILVFGAVRPQPWVHEGEVAVRQVTQLTLAFDHRLVDGQLGAQVLHHVARTLEDPTRLLLAV